VHFLLKIYVKCYYDYLYGIVNFLLVVGWPWLDARCPPSSSITAPPQLDSGEKVRWKAHGSG